MVYVPSEQGFVNILVVLYTAETLCISESSLLISRVLSLFSRVLFLFLDKFRLCLC